MAGRTAQSVFSHPFSKSVKKTFKVMIEKTFPACVAWAVPREGPCNEKNAVGISSHHINWGWMSIILPNSLCAKTETSFGPAPFWNNTKAV